MTKITADECSPEAARSRPMFCRVIGLGNVTPELKVVRLGMVRRAPFRFAAGQYAKLAFGDQRPRDFSIASRPDEPAVSSASERPGSLAPYREAICPAAASVLSGT
jgi:hypothetical protein